MTGGLFSSVFLRQSCEIGVILIEDAPHIGWHPVDWTREVIAAAALVALDSPNAGDRRPTRDDQQYCWLRMKKGMKYNKKSMAKSTRSRLVSMQSSLP